MAVLKYTDLREGKLFQEGGDYFRVIKYTNTHRGRGGATVRVKVRNAKTGAVLEKTYTENQTVEDVDVVYRKAQLMYKEKDSVHFMDVETYEQFAVSSEVCGGGLAYLKGGESVVLLEIEGSVCGMDIPKTLTLKVTKTENAVKGDTSSNTLKEATVESGAVVKVPLFIKVGDKVIVNTETGEYKSKG